MKYIGFGGHGYQVRDVLHIDDLCELIYLQIKKFSKISNLIFTVGGSKKSNTSLKELTYLCEKISKNKIKFDKITKSSIYDIPYYLSDNRFVSKMYGWKPKKSMFNIVNDIYIWITEHKKILIKYF